MHLYVLQGADHMRADAHIDDAPRLTDYVNSSPGRHRNTVVAIAHVILRAGGMQESFVAGVTQLSDPVLDMSSPEQRRPFNVFHTVLAQVRPPTSQMHASQIASLCRSHPLQASSPPLPTLPHLLDNLRTGPNHAPCHLLCRPWGPAPSGMTAP